MTDRARRAIAALNTFGWDLSDRERRETCHECDTRLVPNARFCHACGAAVTTQDSPIVREIEAAIAAANQEPTA